MDTAALMLEINLKKKTEMEMFAALYQLRIYRFINRKKTP